MKNQDKRVEERRTIITGLGLAAAGMAVATAGTSRAQQSGGFMPARHGIDAWMGELGGRHRIFIDTASANGGGEALLYANNLFNAQQEAYEGSDGDLAMIVCFRHFSTPFGYNDAAWKKYGELFSGLMEFSNPATGGAPESNLMNVTDVEGLPNLGVTLDTVTARGTQFAICNAATQFVAGQIANSTGQSADDVHDELAANLIPSARLVPAGVMALTRSQEYGYSVLIAG